MGGKGKVLIAGALIVAAVIYLVISNTSHSAHYFLTIEELQTMESDALVGRNLTVSGAVLGDTIAYDASQPRLTFTVVQMPGDPKAVERAGGLATVLHNAVNDPDAPRLEVVYEDVKPDLLQHESQAIMRGQMRPDGRFYADEVLLKCPTRYEEDIPDQATGGS
jgi:cytochrome c-type biogenesis protein CcmE